MHWGSEKHLKNKNVHNVMHFNGEKESTKAVEMLVKAFNTNYKLHKPSESLRWSHTVTLGSDSYHFNIYDCKLN